MLGQLSKRRVLPALVLGLCLTQVILRLGIWRHLVLGLCVGQRFRRPQRTSSLSTMASLGRGIAFMQPMCILGRRTDYVSSRLPQTSLGRGVSMREDNACSMLSQQTRLGRGLDC